jgi:hypothetical protein
MTAKTWISTGASSGFGRAFAEHALAQGHNVVATARQHASLNRRRGTAAPERVLALSLDVTRQSNMVRRVVTSSTAALCWTPSPNEASIVSPRSPKLRCTPSPPDPERGPPAPRGCWRLPRLCYSQPRCAGRMPLSVR